MNLNFLPVQLTRLPVWSLLLLLVFSCARTDEIHVSPVGDDAHDGTHSQPVQTLHRAAELARAQLADRQTRDLVILLDEGTYRLDRPLELGPQHGGQNDFTVRFQARPGTRPVVSGGWDLAAWTHSENGLWVANLPDALAERLPEAGFRELFVDGQRAVRARYPDTGYLRVERAVSDRRSGFYFYPGDLPEDIQAGDAEVVLLHDWSISRMPVASIDHTQSLLMARYPIGTLMLPFFTIDNWEPHPRYYLENHPRFLSRPGEWYYDRKQRQVWLLASEDQDPNLMQITIPVLSPHLLRIEGTSAEPVRNLAFEGITFEHAAWMLPPQGYPGIQAAHYDPRDGGSSWDVVPAAVYVTHAEQVHFSNLTMRNLGGSGLWLGRNTQHCSVSGSLFDDISANGIVTGDGRSRIDGANNWESTYPDFVTFHNHIIGNTVTRTGQQFYGSVGIWAGITAETVIRANHVHNVPYTAVSIGWEWSETPTPARKNTVSLNHIHDVMLTLGDGGGIYALGLQPESRFTENFIHGVRSSQGRAPSNGMFIDQGAAQVLISGNIVYDTEQAPFRFHMAGENLVSDNLVVLDEGVSIATFNNMPVENIRFENNQELSAGATTDRALLDQARTEWLRRFAQEREQ